MAAKGYTSPLLVSQELGDLTAPQLDQCADLIAEAEAYIDRYTGRAWAVASPIVDELYTVTGPYLYLHNRPITAITALKVRVGAVGAPDITLTAGSQYELIDGPHGIVLINASYPFGFDVVVNTTEYAGYILKVSYTTATPVPGDIQRAATLLTASWLGRRLSTDSQSKQALAVGIKSYAVGSGDLAVVFRDDAAGSVGMAPDSVLQILKAHRVMLFA